MNGGRRVPRVFGRLRTMAQIHSLPYRPEPNTCTGYGLGETAMAAERSSLQSRAGRAATRHNRFSGQIVDVGTG